jgi:hypothetical protein
MRRGFCLSILCVLFALPVFADDPKKAPAKDDKKADADKYTDLGKVAGVLTNTGGSEVQYTIRVTIPILQANQQAQADYVRKQQQLAQRQVQIMANRNPIQRRQQMLQLLRDAQQMPQNLFTVKEVKEDIRAVPTDDMKVRLAQPPPAYDDKGNIKKYTEKELKELKGPDNLPGYTGTLDDVKSNQLVLVYLARKPVKAGDKPKDADKPKDGDKKLDKDNPVVVRMIVVLGDNKK